MDFQLTYRLIQQTPLIHFQHDQKGATLRATEVKPKLDRFIIEKMGGEDEVPGKWFIGDTKALDYKMRIVTEGEPEISCMAEYEIAIKSLKDLLKKKKYELVRSYSRTLDEECKNLESKIKGLTKKRDAEINSMYFGNMVSDKETDYGEAVREGYKETVFYPERDQVQLNVICFTKELREKIEAYIEEFFFVNNFGTRQSKGFGGFTAIKLVDVKEEIGKEPIKTLSEKGYRFFYAEMNGESTEMLNHAKNIYAVMKGGYNHTGWDERSECYKYEDRYIKGYIHRRFLDEFGYNDKGSDKAFIKSKKKLAINKKTNKPYEYSKKRHGQPEDYKYNDYEFVRALFGLADNYEFRGIREGKVDVFGVAEDGNSFGVERFKSPITVKIIGNKLIFLFGDFSPICNRKRFFFAPNGIPNKKAFDKKTDSEKLNEIINNKSVFEEIHTIEKFGDDEIITFINRFVMYFEKEKATLGKFSKNEINMSKNLQLIVPKHIERSF